MPVVSLQSMMSESSRRRKTYFCMHCEKEGKQYITPQYKMVAHVYKNHLPLAKAPFYCKLCLFRCSTRTSLINHVSQYGRHRWAASQVGESQPYSQRHCVVNPNPVTVQLGTDFRELTMQEELNHKPSSVEHEDFFDNESDFLGDIKGQGQVSGTSQPVCTSSLISVQLTPNQLATLLQPQLQTNQQICLPQPMPTTTLMNRQQPFPPNLTDYKPVHQIEGPVTSMVSVPSQIPDGFFLATTTSISRVSETSQNLYSPQSFMPAYEPTPITTCTQSKMSPVASTSLQPHSCMQRTPTQTLARSDSVKDYGPTSEINTPSLSEDLRPQLLGRGSQGQYDGFEEEFTTWLDHEAGERRAEPIQNPTTDEPKLKKPRIQEEEEVRQTASESQTTSDNWIKAMESLVAKTTGPLVKAMEDGARAVRCVDKTLQTLVETMGKVNRNIERIGEEMRREHERRWEAEERKTKEEIKKGEQNTEKKSNNSRRETDRVKETRDKENKPLKSVVNKK